MVLRIETLVTKRRERNPCELKNEPNLRIYWKRTDLRSATKVRATRAHARPALAIDSRSHPSAMHQGSAHPFLWSLKVGSTQNTRGFPACQVHPTMEKGVENTSGISLRCLESADSNHGSRDSKSPANQIASDLEPIA